MYLIVHLLFKSLKFWHDADTSRQDYVFFHRDKYQHNFLKINWLFIYNQKAKNHG